MAFFQPGDFVWLFGAGFNPAAGQTQVTVNGTRCYAQVIDPGLLVFFVATGATSGPVTVTVAGVTATSPTNLTIRSTAPAAGATVGAPTAAAAAPEKITYYHFDALGSPVAATNEQGQVIWRERYEPYGDRIDKPATANPNTRWHTGHVQDQETGLVYAGARYYDPTLGRFLGIDPKGPSPDSLHSVNRYGYGNNSPYKYIDPDGQVPVDTVVDAGYVVYDFGRLLGAGAAYTVGTVTGNEFLRAEGAAGLRDTGIDLGGSATGFVVPYAPAAVTRGIGKGIGEAAKRTTESGIGVTRHGVEQKINRQVKSSDELDAIKNPLDVGPIKTDKFGRPSQRSIGRKAEVVRNPETGDIVSVNPTSSKKAERLLRR